MPLLCPIDSQPGSFLPSKPRGEPTPKDHTRCQRPECGKQAWQHWTVRP